MRAAATLILALAFPLGVPAHAEDAATDRHRVLLELFTSQG